MTEASTTRLAGVLASLLTLCIAVHADDTNQGATDGEQIDSEKIVNPFAGRDDLVPEGKTAFNLHCSHCHGPNAFQGERPRDLRRLTKRYRDDVAEVFLTTALNGRPEKGMPPWKGVIEEEKLWKIFTFLSTVQKK